MRQTRQSQAGKVREGRREKCDRLRREQSRRLEEDRERELCEEEGTVAVVSQLGPPLCRDTHLVNDSVWRERQEEDRELAPVLQWVHEGQRPSREEVAPLSPTTETVGWF